ncbi:MAG: chitobiase/beta-hexosaminidase C-terminal domain-containing protein [Lentihominibacter sp.]
MSKRTKRWLSIVTTLAVAFVMTFGCMGEVFAAGGQTDGEQPASVEQSEPADTEGEAAAEPAEQEEAVEGDVEALGEEPAAEDVLALTVKQGDNSVPFYIDENGADDNGKPQLYYYAGETKTYLPSVDVDYTAMNNQGNGDALYDACGPTVESILEAAGITDYANGSIKFAAADGYSVTFGCNELFKTRYAYPSSRANYEKGEGTPDYGAAVTTKEKRFKKEVPAIVNLNGDKQNCFGQEGPSDRNKPGFVQGVADKGVIEVFADEPKACVETSVVGTVKSFVGYTLKKGKFSETEATVVEAFTDKTTKIFKGTELGLAIPENLAKNKFYLEQKEDAETIKDTSSSDAVHFTTDGTDPTIDSPIYNWDSKTGHFQTIKADTEGKLTIKSKVYSAGKGSPASTVSTSEYEVVAINPSVASKVSYNGKALQPKVSINGLTEGTDYTVAYRNNVKTGVATADITGIGTYGGKDSVSFRVVPAKAAISASSKSKRITVKVTNNTGASKYKVQYKRKGTSKWTTKTTTSKSYKTGKLRKGKYYYVRVLAVDNSGYYTGYSAVKTIKVR